ncbi:MAG: 16S rRNA (cytosine(967)-C(5))-methyltransferase RsmB [Lentisphaerae bacterium]|nr:16S rRNA (cytosine(967)-C(5))-methyltransferase RsmB [Lentisphaerota bacterium]
MPPQTTRSEALRILTRWLQTDEFPDRMLTGSGPSRAFLMEMVYGAVRHRRSLEWLAAQCSDRSPAPAALPALLLGIQQLIFMDGVPDYAAVNDTVNALKASSHSQGQASYVNAILRRIIRERERLLAALARQSIGIRESHPDPLVERWTATFGAARCLALCQWNNSRPGIVVRPRPGADAFDRSRRALIAAGIAFERHPYAPDQFLSIGHGVRVTELPGFRKGELTVHDPATIEAVELLDPQPGQRVLDACASPGGKTALIADRMGSKGELVACDIHADRMSLLRDTLGRLSLPRVELVQADLRQEALPEALTKRPFDRILLDVPCSNTGVLRRRPDARWRFDPQRLRHTVALQRALLDRTALLLKPGGTLVYSTCSLEREENETQIENWLRTHPMFQQTDSRSCFPPTTQTDGAYAAALVAVG